MTVSVQKEVMLWNYLITIPLCSYQRKTVEILSCSKFQQSLKQTNLWLYGWRRQPQQQKRHWSSHDPMHGKLTQVSTAWRVLHQLAALQQWTVLIHSKFAKLRFLTVRVFLMDSSAHPEHHKIQKSYKRESATARFQFSLTWPGWQVLIGALEGSSVYTSKCWGQRCKKEKLCIPLALASQGAKKWNNRRHQHPSVWQKQNCRQTSSPSVMNLEIQQSFIY